MITWCYELTKELCGYTWIAERITVWWQYGVWLRAEHVDETTPQGWSHAG